MKNSLEELFFSRIPYFRWPPRQRHFLVICLVLLSSSVRGEDDTITCLDPNTFSTPSCDEKFLCLYRGAVFKCFISPHDKTGEGFGEEKVHHTSESMLCSMYLNKTWVRTQSLKEQKMTRIRRQASDVMSDPNDKIFGYSKQYRWEHPLLVLNILACVTLTILVSLAIIVFLVCGMFYQDCLAHMCSEMALLQAYICLLSVTTNIDQLNMTACSVTAIMLHYFFTVVFLCQTMEVYFMCRLLYYQCPRYFLRDPYSLLLIAWGVPAIFTGVSAHLLYDSYAISVNNCWLHVYGSSMLVVVIPICVFVGMQIVMLLAVFCVANPPYHKQTTEYFRARACLTTRWASLIILLLTCLAWSMGILALNLQYRSFYIVFCLASIFLGASVLVVRIATERQVRMMIWTKFFPSAGALSVPWPVSSFDNVDDISDQIHYGWKTPAIVFGSLESIQTRY